MMRYLSRFRLAIFLIAITVLGAMPTSAQDPGPAQNQDRQNRSESGAEPTLKIDSNLVLLNISVLDDKSNFVPGLASRDFRVFDEEVEQKIELFSKEAVPVSLGLVIDTSGSMRFKLKPVQEAAQRLLAECRPGDEVFIVDMKDTPRIRFAQQFTEDFELAKTVVRLLYPSGGTALLDGIAAAAKYSQEKARHHRRALIVISDGDDRDSSIKVEQLREQLRELNLQVYLLGFPEGFVGVDGEFIETAPGRARNLMKKIAKESGGQAFFPHTLAEIGQYTIKIGEELRTQYTIGYYPSNDNGSARYHRLQVKLSDKKRKYALRTRPGYFAQR